MTPICGRTGGSASHTLRAYPGKTIETADQVPRHDTVADLCEDRRQIRIGRKLPGGFICSEQPGQGKRVVPIGPLDDEGRGRFGEFAVAIAGMTHVGRVRRVNQDAFDRFDDAERGEVLLVVADGMGGHQGGEIASRIAVGTLGKLCREGDGSPQERLAHAIEQANAEIHKRASKDRTLKGMGTTVVALLLCEQGPSYVAHVGDSRFYRLRDDVFEALTEDHSVVALLIRNGEITPEEARDHPKRNQIMRALGVRDDVDLDIAPIEIQPGDSYLLCSDGLYAMLPDDDLKTLALRAPDPHAVVAWMIDAANQAGGMDNITAVVARFDAAENPAESSPC